MSCGYGNRFFNQTLNFETCEHAECTSSTNSLHHLCQVKDKGDDNVDGEINKCYKQ